MADYSLKDRLDLPIWNALEANNVKQALKVLEKRLLRNKSDHLEALKVYVRSRSPLLSEKSAVLLLIEEFVESKKVLSDPEDIDLYHDALENVFPKPGRGWSRLIGEIRWQSVRALPKNEEMGLKCFEACLAHDDWEHGQQIASTLEKSFPNQHKYVFWNIISLFLRSLSKEVAKDKASLWGRLAFGQISKFAIATRQVEGKSPPVRAIHSAQELLLLQKLAASYGSAEDRLKYLQDPHLGPESAVAKGDWELWRQYLQLLAEMQKWDELYSLTSSLLERARTRNTQGEIIEARMADWTVWNAYLTSASSLQRPRWTDEASAEVAAHLDPASGVDKAWRRNASIAWLRIVFANASTNFRLTKTDHALPEYLGGASGKVSAVVQFFEKSGDATTAYTDLKLHVEQLDMAERKSLLKALNCDLNASEATSNRRGTQGALSLGQNLRTFSGINRRVNAYKLAYLILSSLAEHERLACPTKKGDDKAYTCKYCSGLCSRYCESCLANLAYGSIESYKSAIEDDGQISQSLLSTDRHPADDFAIIAAMCLIKLTKYKKSQAVPLIIDSTNAGVLQAIIMLEKAYARSTANFQISLLLIRLYASIGCGSLAVKVYQRLGVKGIQQDTLSYILFDRISSLHPLEFSQSQDIRSKMSTPVDYFNKQHRLYKSVQKQVRQNCWLAFEQGSYNSILEFKEFSDTVSRTLSAANSAIESQRLARISMQKPLSSYDALPSDPELLEHFHDTNDYATFPNFERSDGPTFDQICRFAPGPSTIRYRLSLISERLFHLLDPASASEFNRSAEYLRFKRQLHPIYKALLSQTKFGVDAELTHAERMAAEAYDLIAGIIFDSQDTEMYSDADFLENLCKQNNRLLECLQEQGKLLSTTQHAAPALWNTLHSLYMAWELGKAASDLTRVLSSSSQKVHKLQIAANKKLAEQAQELLTTAWERAKAAKTRMDESGWIDKVIDSVLQKDGIGASERHKGSTESVVGPLKEVIDEGFVEEWAGNLVESWRDSVSGLSYLKTVEI